MSAWRFAIFEINNKGAKLRVCPELYKSLDVARTERKRLARQFPNRRYLLKTIKADRDDN